MLEERRREILAQVFREQNKQECDGALFGKDNKALVAMRRAEVEIAQELRDALADLVKTASAAGPFITGQAAMVAERLGATIERARTVLTRHDHDRLVGPLSFHGVEIAMDTIEQMTGQVNHRGEKI